MLSGDIEMNPVQGQVRSAAVISGYIDSTPFSGAVADDNTAVYEVFREHFDQLVRAMGTSPTALIPVLYSKQLISEDEKIALSTLTHTNDIEKATRILNAVEIEIKAAAQSSTSDERVCEAV